MGIMSDAKYLVSLSRPRFWLYLGGTYMIGFAAGADSFSLFLSPLFVLHLLFFLTFANLFLYGINDLSDTDTDRFNRKKGSKEVRLSDHRKGIVKSAVFFSLLISLAFAILQPGLEATAAFFAFIFLSYSSNVLVTSSSEKVS
jgi:4-hydroxybenzoate polyprenyltransferase